MKPQEIFNKAAIHLMGMDGPCVDAEGDACAYRGTVRDEYDDYEFNGQKCAVGLFIEDKYYEEHFEGSGITGDASVANAVAWSWGQEHLTEDQLELLSDLQKAHDDINSSWSENIVLSLDKVADKHHLRFDPKGSSA